MDCQLEQLPAMGHELGFGDRLILRIAKNVRWLQENWKHLPGGLARRIRERLGRGPTPVERAPHAPTAPVRLGLRPGERVRVRSREEILGTLDEHGRCHGLAYAEVMDRFCGLTFTVRKRIGRFFDESTRAMLRVRDVVILDGVFCEPAVGDQVDYGGCDRTCYLFWKEAWLERVTSSGS